MIDLLITAGEPSRVKDFMGPRGIAFKEIIPKRPEGRPTVMTAEVLQKLEDAFAHAFTDKEACFFAGIAEKTLYNYCAANPEFLQRKEALKLSPNIKAKRKLVADIEGSLAQAQWWAGHKMSDEFAPRTKVDTKDTTERIPATPEVLKVVERFNLDLREAIAAPLKKP